MQIPWWGLLPFITMLAAIAILPLLKVTAPLWERNLAKLAIALTLGIPVAAWMWLSQGSDAVVHAVVEYGQFIILLLALFVVSGGIFLSGDIRATPRNNTLFIAAGGIIASFVGTTGAAMLFIRPILNTNSERRYRVHTVVFTIFAIANCGGLLTPLGDPPLFLGMLRGVPFSWTFILFREWAFVLAMLLLTYYALDRRAYARETSQAIAFDESNVRPLRIRGGVNFVFFAMVIVAVAFVPSIDLHAIAHGHASVRDWLPLREMVMVAAAVLSFTVGDKQVRFKQNRFSWHPIVEVAALFIGIFLTMIPALKFLAQIAPKLPLNEITFYYFTGGLSSVLDNAPTYATFFEMAKYTPLASHPEAGLVAGVPHLYLVAISLAAVFWGAVTYIGNGPNFMVKAVAESRGVVMPDFGSYTAKALLYLVPILVAVQLIFVTRSTWTTILGLVLAAALVARDIVIARSHLHPDEVGSREPTL